MAGFVTLLKEQSYAITEFYTILIVFVVVVVVVVVVLIYRPLLEYYGSIQDEP